jgi:hypothetical protein
MLNNILYELMQILSPEFRVYAARFRPLQLLKRITSPANDAGPIHQRSSRK